jgi:hypothetical protein
MMHVTRGLSFNPTLVVFISAGRRRTVSRDFRAYEKGGWAVAQASNADGREDFDVCNRHKLFLQLLLTRPQI